MNQMTEDNLEEKSFPLCLSPKDKDETHLTIPIDYLICTVTHLERTNYYWQQHTSLLLSIDRPYYMKDMDISGGQWL